MSPDFLDLTYADIGKHCQRFKGISMQKFEDQRAWFWDLKQTKQTEWLLSQFDTHDRKTPSFAFAGVTLCRGKLTNSACDVLCNC